MENKIATTTEQSKKLLELGINQSTADMYWWHYGEKTYLSGMYDGEFNKWEEDVPAWSLSALLKLIPKEQHPKLILNANYKWVCEISKPIPFTYKPTVGDNPLDAVFEMIVYLKENKIEMI